MANPVCEVLLTERELEFPRKEPDLSTGAIIDFWGVVRGIEGGRKIDGIEYEAHRSMAQHQLRSIAEEAVGKFGLQLVIIHHRLGFVPVGKPSLLLRVATRHRAQAFQAGQWIVDELKSKAPIWKHPKFKIEHEALKKGAEMERDLA